MSYYGDLSSCSSREESDSEESECNRLDNTRESPSNEKRDRLTEVDTGKDGLWSRSIIHLDIDCFYCQCEEIDRNLRHEDPPRPLAIGQKHIIVTSNYTARKFGVKKLQGRESAKAACPGLMIVEGSDLQHYRRHSRAVYEAFRSGLQEIASEIHGELSSRSSRRPFIPAQMGSGMDEMYAELTPVVESIEMKKSRPASSIFVYGECEKSSTTVLVEDQTGVAATISSNPSQQNSELLSEWRKNVHENYGSENDRRACIKRLYAASQLAQRLRRHIFDQTSFYTTIGISVCPLLAKLATGLQKPDSVNILYPWRSAHLMYGMPLRKLNNVGRGTMRALDSLFEKYCLNSRSDFWTVRDLLGLPREAIVESLAQVKGYANSSKEQCESLLQHCRGLDETKILDDHGDPSKTVSVENSFRRGTVRSLQTVWTALDDLFVRLPKLLKDRKSWSHSPDHAFPTKIRFTVRLVDLRLKQKKRPFVTKSRQSAFDGKGLMQEESIERQSQLLKDAVSPLVSHLLNDSDGKDINVTRLNIAVTNFQDPPKNGCSVFKADFSARSTAPSSTQVEIKSLEFQALSECRTVQKKRSSPTKDSQNQFSPIAVRRSTSKMQTRSISSSSARQENIKGLGSGNKLDRDLPAQRKTNVLSKPTIQIDPSVLAALPPEIVREVLQEYGTQSPSKKTRIDHYFMKKSVKESD